MAEEGQNRAYTAFADIIYLDRANKDVKLYRKGANILGIDDGLDVKTIQPAADDTYYLGTTTLGWKGLHTPNMLIDEEDNATLAVRNNADDAYRALHVGWHYVEAGLAMQADGIALATANVDGRYYKLQARDTGVGLVEVARAEGAADPAFKMGNDGNAIVATYAGLVGLFSTTPASQPATEADPTDLNTCITAITNIIDKLQSLGILGT